MSVKFTSILYLVTFFFCLIFSLSALFKFYYPNDSLRYLSGDYTSNLFSRTQIIIFIISFFNILNLKYFINIIMSFISLYFLFNILIKTKTFYFNIFLFFPHLVFYRSYVGKELFTFFFIVLTLYSYTKRNYLFFFLFASTIVFLRPNLLPFFYIVFLSFLFLKKLYFSFVLTNFSLMVLSICYFEEIINVCNFYLGNLHRMFSIYGNTTRDILINDIPNLILNLPSLTFAFFFCFFPSEIFVSFKNFVIFFYYFIFWLFFLYIIFKSTYQFSLKYNFFFYISFIVLIICFSPLCIYNAGSASRYLSITPYLILLNYFFIRDLKYDKI